MLNNPFLTWQLIILPAVEYPHIKPTLISLVKISELLIFTLSNLIFCIVPLLLLIKPTYDLLVNKLKLLIV